MSKTPWMEGGMVPGYSRPVEENLRWRWRVMGAALGDGGLQRALREACFGDVLFWFNAMTWLVAPQSARKVQPFVTWPHQDPVILEMDGAIERTQRTGEMVDLVLDKSRCQGATWMYLMVILRRWLRDEMFHAGLVTRTEDLVDSLTDPDTLGWKIAWELDRLPGWMLPAGFRMKEHRRAAEHTFVNPEKFGTIAGYSATKDVGRGGRKAVFVMDEIGAEQFQVGGKDYAAMDSTQHVTNCRFLVSTYGGSRGVFYEAATGGSTRVTVKCVLDWKDNPTQNRLLYVMLGGKAAAVRKMEEGLVATYVRENRRLLEQLERRGHKVEGKTRSPWYDSQCLRPGATPRSIGKELDRNPTGASGKVFLEAVLESAAAHSVRTPVWRGRVVFDASSGGVVGFLEQVGGPLSLWFSPGLDLSAPRGLYVLGCDLSAGVGGSKSSNSVACGVDQVTGEQVLEYVTNTTIPTHFARHVAALGRWLRDAHVAWEATGPCGAGFGKELVEGLGYGNYYERRTVWRSRRDVDGGVGGSGGKPGWWNNTDQAKVVVFEGLCVAMQEGRFTPRSIELVQECGEYEWERGKIVHRAARLNDGDGKAHGDRAVAAAVAWMALAELRSAVSAAVDKEGAGWEDAPYGSWGWREQREEKLHRRWTDDEPQFSLGDLLR